MIQVVLIKYLTVGRCMRYLILGGLIKHLMFESFMRYLIQVGLIKISRD